MHCISTARVAVTLTALVAGCFPGIGGGQVATAAATGPYRKPLQRRDHRPRDVTARSGSPQYIANKERADAVKQTFQVSWDGYYKYAFPHDSLRPVRNRFYDDRYVTLLCSM